MSTLCIIPAKGLSTRLPRKNVLPFEGHPLIAHAIRKGLASGLVQNVCVSTEDAEIMETAKAYGAQAPFVRPPSLSVDPATIVDVCLHALDWYTEHQGIQYSKILVLLPTSPLVPLHILHEAWQTFMNAGGTSCVLSVSTTEQPPYTTQRITDDGYLAPLFANSEYANAKSNECPTAYHSNGCIAIADVEWLRRHNSFYAQDTTAFVTPRIFAVDIDTEEDYKMALALARGNSELLDQGLFDANPI